MIKNEDNVMEKKRRIEYGVKKIMLEVGDIVKINEKEINDKMKKRFDKI